MQWICLKFLLIAHWSVDIRIFIVRRKLTRLRVKSTQFSWYVFINSSSNTNLGASWGRVRNIMHMNTPWDQISPAVLTVFTVLPLTSQIMHIHALFIVVRMPEWKMFRHYALCSTWFWIRYRWLNLLGNFNCVKKQNGHQNQNTIRIIKGCLFSHER